MLRQCLSVGETEIPLKLSQASADQKERHKFDGRQSIKALRPLGPSADAPPSPDASNFREREPDIKGAFIFLTRSWSDLPQGAAHPLASTQLPKLFKACPPKSLHNALLSASTAMA